MYPLLPCLSASWGRRGASREGSAPFWVSSRYPNSQPGNPHSACAQEGCGAEEGLLGAGALTAPLTLAASFLSPGHQTLNGKECPVGESGAAAVGGAAGMATRGRGQRRQGMVRSTPALPPSFRSVSPPCPTSPGLWM